jgi:hypothetical protein
MGRAGQVLIGIAVVIGVALLARPASVTVPRGPVQAPPPAAARPEPATLVVARTSPGPDARTDGGGDAGGGPVELAMGPLAPPATALSADGTALAVALTHPEQVERWRLHVLDVGDLSAAVPPTELEGFSGALAISADGAEVAWLAGDPDGVARVTVTDRGRTGRTVRLPGLLPQEVVALGDGEVAVVGDPLDGGPPELRLLALDADGAGTSRRVALPEGVRAADPAAGALLVLLADGSALVRVDLRDGTTTPAPLALPAGRWRQLVVAGDRALAVGADADGPVLAVLDPATGTVEDVRPVPLVELLDVGGDGAVLLADLPDAEGLRDRLLLVDTDTDADARDADTRDAPADADSDADADAGRRLDDDRPLRAAGLDRRGRVVAVRRDGVGDVVVVSDAAGVVGERGVAELMALHARAGIVVARRGPASEARG